MKLPEEPPLGSRKTLPARKSRKTGVAMAKAKRKAGASTGNKPAKKTNLLDKDVQRELVRAFGEK